VSRLKENNVISIEDRIPRLKEQRKKKANRRLIYLMLLFFTLIAVVVYFQSPLSHIQSITVHNNIVYNSDLIIKESGISLNDNIWSIEKDKVTERLEKLPQVETAEFTIKFPNHVNINIVEYRKIGYVYSESKYIPVLENGKLLTEDKVEFVKSYAPILFSFREGVVLNEMIKELEEIPESVLNSISEIHSTPKSSDELSITVFMNDGYEVIATIRDFADKIQFYPDIVNQLDPTVKGVIDLEVGSFFKAYESNAGAEETKEEDKTNEE